MKFVQVGVLCDNFFPAQHDNKCRRNLPEKCPNVWVGPNFNFDIPSQLIHVYQLDIS